MIWATNNKGANLKTQIAELTKCKSAVVTGTTCSTMVKKGRRFIKSMRAFDLII